MNNTLTHTATIESLATKFTEEEGVLGARILAPLNPELWRMYPGWRKIEIKVDPKTWPQFFGNLVTKNGYASDDKHQEWETWIREQVERTEFSLGCANPIAWEIVSEYPWVRPTERVITEIKIHPRIPRGYDQPRVQRWAELTDEEWDLLLESERVDLIADYFRSYETEVINY